MAETLAPSTRVEAVNALLRTISEKPVTTLEGGSRAVVNRAIQEIDKVARAVQKRGWWFNSEPDIELAPVGGQYVPPSNVLSAKVSEINRTHDTVHLVWRGTKFYHRKNRTSTGHTDTLKFDYIVQLEWDDLPESAREYIYHRAGVAFQAESLGASILFNLTEDQAQVSWRDLMAEDMSHERYNVLRSTVAGHRDFRTR